MKVYHFTVPENEELIKHQGLKAACNLAKDARLPRETLDQRKRCVFAWVKPEQDERNFGSWDKKVAFAVEVDPDKVQVGSFNVATEMLMHCFTDQKTIDCQRWSHIYETTLQTLSDYLRISNDKTGTNPEVLITEDIPPERISRVPEYDIKKEHPFV